MSNKNQPTEALLGPHPKRPRRDEVDIVVDVLFIYFILGVGILLALFKM